MDYVAQTTSNPFGLDPPCERFVPGYGDPNADFHVVGDNPLVHGGETTGIPFTDREWSVDFFETLQEGNLVQSVDLSAGQVGCQRTFFSYIHMCEPETGGPSTASDSEMEPYFDAELRAITAHVLVPVGPRATAHVLETCTATVPEDPPAMADLHANEIHGAGWLVIPCKNPEEWDSDERRALVDRFDSLGERDYRQISDLGRFIAGSDPYLVR